MTDRNQFWIEALCLAHEEVSADIADLANKLYRKYNGVDVPAASIEAIVNADCISEVDIYPRPGEGVRAAIHQQRMSDIHNGVIPPEIVKRS